MQLVALINLTQFFAQKWIFFVKFLAKIKLMFYF